MYRKLRVRPSSFSLLPDFISYSYLMIPQLRVKNNNINRD